MDSEIALFSKPRLQITMAYENILKKSFSTGKGIPEIWSQQVLR